MIDHLLHLICFLVGGACAVLADQFFEYLIWRVERWSLDYKLRIVGLEPNEGDTNRMKAARLRHRVAVTEYVDWSMRHGG